MLSLLAAATMTATIAGFEAGLDLSTSHRAAQPEGSTQPEPGLEPGAAPMQPAPLTGPFELLFPPAPVLPPMIEVRPPITVSWDPRLLDEAMQRRAWLDTLAGEIIRPPASLEGALRPVEVDGLLACVNSVSASATLQQTTYGSGGAQIQRSISINGSVCDLSGTRSFRIVGSPRVVEFTDDQGMSMLDATSWQTYPNDSSTPGFTRPDQSPGSVQQQGFSISSDRLASLPHVIGTLRIELDVALADECQEFEVRGERSGTFQTLAPGIEARVSTLIVEGGATHVGVEYRLTDTCDGSGRACFVSAEVLDDERRVLGALEIRQEATTRRSVMGTATGWGLDTRRGPAWTIRLRFAPASATRRMEIVEQNVPLLGV